MDEPRVNTDSQNSPQRRLGGSHHLPPYNILYAWPQGVGRLFVPLLSVLQGEYILENTNATGEGKNASVFLDVRLRL
jgi:hypothetical protein